MIIKSNIKSYNVHIEEDFGFINELSKINNAEIVIDKNVYEIYEDLFSEFSKDNIFVIEAIESNKVIETALEICEKMTGMSAKRNATIVSIGGGIIQDITGFVASVLYRGIKWVFVPTTLLAACDSCIGGKTSLNYKKYKNLLGTFYPPDNIYICSKFFATLSDKDYKSGLGEVVKFNLMAGKDEFSFISKDIKELLDRNIEKVNLYVKKSLMYKKPFIEIDEFDRGDRIKLNFAHTFGHAIETITGYNIPHGTAVAIGMIMANYVSHIRGILSADTMFAYEGILLKVIDIKHEIMSVDIKVFIDAMYKDKKQIDKNLSVVLMKEDNDKITCLQVVRDIEIVEVEKAIEHFINVYKQSKGD